MKDGNGVIVCECGNDGHANAIAAALNATLPPDLLRAALKVVTFFGPWDVGLALRYPASIGVAHDELHAAGAEIQARAREALATMDGGGSGE
ncbi:MAG: hypothetical protein ACYCU7_19015 [Acidimicrobiales bacterium]